jgi:ferritin-like metal-binding protein YciE
MGLLGKDIQNMDDLLVHGLQDIYYAENQISSASSRKASSARPSTA